MASICTYEIINYVNDVSLENAQVLMTSDKNGNYNQAYTYGLDRISVDYLSSDIKEKRNPLYYLNNGRGSVAQLTNSRGQIRDEYSYDPFGVVDHDGPLGNSKVHYENFYGYNGEDHNRISGLQYLRARYYEPSTGRFLSRDSYLGEIQEPLTLNRYAYAGNNPLMYNDPSGHSWAEFKSNLKKTINDGFNAVKDFGESIGNTIKDVAIGVGNWVNNKFSSASETINDFKNDFSEVKKEVGRYVKNPSPGNWKRVKNKVGNSKTVQMAVTKAEELKKAACESAEYIGKQVSNYSETIIKVATGAAAIGVGVTAVIAAAPLVLPALGVGALSIAATAAGTAIFGTAAVVMGASEISDGLFGVNPAKNLPNNVGISDENYYLGFAMATAGASAGFNALSPMQQNNKAPIQNTNKKQKTDTLGNKGAGKAKYLTNIEGKVTATNKANLPEWVADSFTDGNYRTVVTNDKVTLYRTFGGNADAGGGFATTTSAANRIQAKIDTALLPEWGNTRMYEAAIEVPKGQVLNIGKVAEQYTKTGTKLAGQADQVLLPQNWPLEWIKEIRVVPSK